MQRIVKRITAIIVAFTIVLLNIPNIEAFGEAIGDVTISISVLDTKNESVNDAVIKINGVEVNTQKSDGNTYEINLSGYDTENLDVKVYSSDETVSKSVTYTEGVSDYAVVLPKRLSIENNEVYYDKERGVYVINTPYSSANEYVLNVSEERNDTENGEASTVKFIKEDVEEGTECNNAKVDTEGMTDSAKIKYTSPGIVRVRCSSINNSQIYEDVVVELHITNELSFKYSENRDINSIYSVSKKSDSDEVDTVTIKGRDIGDSEHVDIKLNISADCTEDIAYSVTNSDGFTVDESGIVRCTKYGTTVVKAASTKTGATASYRINIIEDSGNIQIYKVTEGGKTGISSEGTEEIDVLDYYNVKTFDIEGVIGENNSWAYKEATYSSDNSSVAIVDNAGRITINGYGSAKIKVEAANKYKWWKNISASFTLVVNPAAMKVEVEYEGRVLSKDDVLELNDDNEEYMSYDALGNGTSFTLPIDVKAYDTNGNEISTNVTINSDNLTIEGKKVTNPDDIERNLEREYRIVVASNGVYGSTEYVLKIKLVGQRDNNNGYFTVTSGLKTGADGNKWAIDKDTPVVLEGKEIVIDEEKNIKYTYMMSATRDDRSSYDIKLSMLVKNKVQSVNKQHLFYVMDSNDDNRIIQRLYFGVDFNAPTINEVTTTANATAFGIYDNKSISVTIKGIDQEGNLYKAQILDKAGNVVKSESFTVDSEDNKKGFATFSFAIGEYLSKAGDYEICIIDRAGNKSEKIELNKAINNSLKGELPNADNSYVTGNEFLIEKGKAEVDIKLSEASNSVARYVDASNNYYFGDDVMLDVNVYDKSDEINSSAVSGIASFTVEVYTNNSLVQTKNIGLTNLNTKTVSYKYSVNTSDYRLGADGEVTIIVKNIVDNAGNTVGSTAPYTVYIDKTEPAGNIKAVETSGKENVKSYGSFYNKDVKLTLELVDSISGMATATLYVGNREYKGNIVNKEGGISQVQYTLKGNIKGNVSLIIKDKVGHSRSYNLNELVNEQGIRRYESNYIVVENLAPEVSIKETRKPDSNNKWYNKAVDFNISINEKDVISGINRVEVFVNDNKVISDTYDVKGKETDSKKLTLTNDLIEKYVNEAGSYTVKAIVTDNAGNIGQAEKTVYIDTTAPVIDDLSGVENESYNTGVVTVITSVAEKHFSEVGNETTAYVTRTLDGVTEKYQLEAEAVKEADNQYSFVFDKDGTYEVIVKSIDAAGNAAAEKSIKFTLDNTSPFCEITGVTENAYYADKAEMTLKVIESNYDTNVVDISVVRRLDNREYKDYDISFNGTKKEDVLNYTFADEGTYTLRVQAKDKAGNTAFTRTVIFTVDTAAPEITITGVTDMGAYNDSVIPSINISDNYFDNYSVSLTKTGVYFTDEYKGIESIKDLDVTNQFINGMENIEKGVEGSFDTFAKKRENDGLYVLTVAARDKAGRVSQKQVTFSLNRYGSVYTFNDVLTNVMNGYVKEVEGDFVITEYNVNTLTQLSMEVARDGAKVTDLIYEATPLDNSKARGDNGWYKYQYTISKENFVKDGIYVISTTSKDKAGNVSQTLVYDNLYATFAVDNTKPEIVMVSGMEKGTYNADEITVKYKLFDALGVKEVRVYANDKEIYKANEFNNNMDFEDTFNIKAGVNQKIRFEVEDMAGNVTDSENAEDIASGKVVSFNNTVTVTTNFFVRWYSNKVAFFGSVGGVVAAMVGAFVLIYMKTVRGYRKKHTIREETLK